MDFDGDYIHREKLLQRLLLNLLMLIDGTNMHDLQTEPCIVLVYKKPQKGGMPYDPSTYHEAFTSESFELNVFIFPYHFGHMRCRVNVVEI